MFLSKQPNFCLRIKLSIKNNRTNIDKRRKLNKIISSVIFIAKGFFFFWGILEISLSLGHRTLTGYTINCSCLISTVPALNHQMLLANMKARSSYLGLSFISWSMSVLCPPDFRYICEEKDKLNNRRKMASLDDACRLAARSSFLFFLHFSFVFYLLYTCFVVGTKLLGLL